MNLNKTVDNLDINTPVVASHAIQAQRPAPRTTWDVAAVRWIGGLAAAAAAWYVSPEWAHTYVVAASLGLGTLAGAKAVLQDNIAGFRVWTFRNDVRGSQIVQGVNAAALAEASREYPAVSAFSPTYQAAPAPKQLGGATVDAPEVTILPNVGPLAAHEWLARLDAQPHALFAAKTKGGKSTMARYGMQPRIAAGETFFVIDPHSNGWLDLPSIGGGLRWDEVADAISQVTTLYHERHAERRRYLEETGDELPHDYFPRLNIIFDEANEARLNLDKRVWEPFLQVMGSGARKVGVSLWLICQSALIKNLGGSEVMRRNYTVFALDHDTIAELTEGTDRARRELISARIAGSDFPAAMVDQGQAWLLDRTGIDRAVIPSARRLMWDEYKPYAPRQIARAVAAKEQRPPVERASIKADPLDVYRAMSFTDDRARIGWLAYHTKLGTREIRAIVGCHYPDVVAVAGMVRRAKAAREARS